MSSYSRTVSLTLPLWYNSRSKYVFILLLYKVVDLIDWWQYEFVISGALGIEQYYWWCEGSKPRECILLVIFALCIRLALDLPTCVAGQFDCISQNQIPGSLCYYRLCMRSCNCVCPLWVIVVFCYRLWCSLKEHITTSITLSTMPKRRQVGNTNSWGGLMSSQDLHLTHYHGWTPFVISSKFRTKLYIHLLQCLTSLLQWYCES